jgi:hypothetical protein
MTGLKSDGVPRRFRGELETQKYIEAVKYIGDTAELLEIQQCCINVDVSCNPDQDNGLDSGQCHSATQAMHLIQLFSQYRALLTLRTYTLWIMFRVHVFFSI